MPYEWIWKIWKTKINKLLFEMWPVMWNLKIFFILFFLLSWRKKIVFIGNINIVISYSSFVFFVASNMPFNRTKSLYDSKTNLNRTLAERTVPDDFIFCPEFPGSLWRHDFSDPKLFLIHLKDSWLQLE